MDAEFSLQSEIKDNCLIIATNGYVNNEGGEKISAEFDTHFENGVHKLIINLAGSKVVNSIGISFLIEIIEKLNEVGGKLYFTNLDPSIEKTLTIMGLFSFAGKAATVEEAIKSLS